MSVKHIMDYFSTTINTTIVLENEKIEMPPKMVGTFPNDTEASLKELFTAQIWDSLHIKTNTGLINYK